MPIPLIDKFALDALRGRDTPRRRCQRAAARVTVLVAAGTASSLAERFDESNGVVNGVGALRRNLAQKARCKGVVGRLRAIELISATHPAVKDNHQWATKSGAPA